MSRSKWYLANILMYRVIKRRGVLIHTSECLYWDNLILLKSRSAELAYKKAMKYGLEEESVNLDKDGSVVKWTFAGIRDLVEVMNYMEDEQELCYKKRYAKNSKEVKKLIPRKNQLGLLKYERMYKKTRKHTDDYMSKHQQR